MEYLFLLKKYNSTNIYYYSKIIFSFILGKAPVHQRLQELTREAGELGCRLARRGDADWTSWDPSATPLAARCTLF